MTCIDCFKPFYLSPDNDSCVEDCGYCYAKDNKSFRAWQCVNCKTRYKPLVKYNLNGTCVDDIPLMSYPDPDVDGKPTHVLDDFCNLLIGCKGGCFNCTHWYTEKCTKCKPDFYKKDFYSLTQPDYFPCFTKDECHGIAQYPYDLTEETGGVAKILNGEGVCYNCRLREGNYRQVEYNFTCGPRAKRTYVNITYYIATRRLLFRSGGIRPPYHLPGTSYQRKRQRSDCPNFRGSPECLRHPSRP